MSVPEPEQAARRRRLSQRASQSRPHPQGWYPSVPVTLADTGLEKAFVEELIARQLHELPDRTGSQVARRLALPRELVLSLLDGMKHRMLVHRHDTTLMGDFRYQLTEAGRAWAERSRSRSRYVGPAPVPLDQFTRIVRRQGVSSAQARPAQLAQALSDLVLPRSLPSELGPAVRSGRGLFLYGPPGNGKTSIAERIVRTYGDGCWLPHAICVDHTVIQLLDPHVHRRRESSQRHDPRYVSLRRPLIVAGGELRLEALELRFDEATGLCEAPLQLKAACGILVIDDFGRQQVSPEELLNRWIVPLERRVDFLTLPTGRKVTVPFDPFVVFSTNLNPSDLVDEAFLRRIPYKVHLGDPHEGLFREVFAAAARRMKLPVAEGALDHLIDAHYTQTGRPFRYCHPRDLLAAILDQARFHGQAPQVDAEALDRAARGYFIARPVRRPLG